MESVAQVAWTTLQDAAAAPAAATEPGTTGSEVERWPLTCPFRNPYDSYEDFRQNCELLQSFPTKVLELVCSAVFHQWRKQEKQSQQQREEQQQQQGKRRKVQEVEDIGLGPFRHATFPFLEIKRSVEGGATPGNSSIGRLELVVHTAKLRQTVWAWSGSAKQPTSGEVAAVVQPVVAAARHG